VTNQNGEKKTALPESNGDSQAMKKLFWIDLEMTGLDEKVDQILEVAVLITDLDLKTLDSYHRVVFQAPEVLENMNDWCKKTHGKSGLSADVPGGMPLKKVEQELIELANKHYPNPKDRIVLCGNSVGNDKRFIDAYWPDFAKKLHYRLVDVSSFKEIFKARYNIQYKKSDEGRHRAEDDIVQSVKELAHYLSFVKP